MSTTKQLIYYYVTHNMHNIDIYIDQIEIPIEFIIRK